MARYVEHGYHEYAMKIFKEMQFKGHFPKTSTYVHIMECSIRELGVQKAEETHVGMC